MPFLNFIIQIETIATFMKKSDLFKQTKYMCDLFITNEFQRLFEAFSQI